MGVAVVVVLRSSKCDKQPSKVKCIIFCNFIDLYISRAIFLLPIDRFPMPICSLKFQGFFLCRKNSHDQSQSSERVHNPYSKAILHFHEFFIEFGHCELGHFFCTEVTPFFDLSSLVNVHQRVRKLCSVMKLI